MTVDDRGREAAGELAAWAPSGGPGLAKERARRRSTNRRLFVAGVAAVAVGVLAVGLASRDDDQPVIVATSPTTTASASPTTGSGCDDRQAPVVYIRSDATEARIDAIGDELRADERVDAVTYVDEYDTYALYVQMFVGDPSMPIDVDLSSLPTSYNVRLRDADAFEAFQKDWKRRDDVFEVEDGRCPVDPPATTGQRVGDLTFDITELAPCANFTREPGSAREPCPPPVLTTDNALFVAVRPVGEPSDAPWVDIGDDEQFPEGSFVATAWVMLVDWGCSASSEFTFTVSGSGADRSVIVETINGRTVDRAPIVGSPSAVRLTMLAETTHCTGGRPEGSSTSVRVFSDLTPEWNGIAVDEAAVTIVDLDNNNAPVGGWDLGDDPYPMFMEPGNYGLVFSASGSSCPDGTYTGGTRLVVGEDGSLTLGDPTNPDDAVPVPVTIPAPPATPTLIPDDLVADIELRPSCEVSGG